MPGRTAGPAPTASLITARTTAGLALVAIAAGGPASAATRFWAAPADREFDDSIAWTGGIIPAVNGTDAVRFDVSGSYQVQFSNNTANTYGGDPRVQSVQVMNGAPRMLTTAIPRKSLLVDGPGGNHRVEISLGGALHLGLAGNPFRAFDLVAGDSIRVFSGSLNVWDGSRATANVFLDVGTGGGGTLLVSGSGSEARASAGSASHWGSGGFAANVTFQNSGTGSFTGGVELARTNTSTTNISSLNVLSGASLNIGNVLRIAHNGGSGTNATASIQGSGSNVTMTGAAPLVIGHGSSGFARLNIGTSTSGGVFNAGSSSGNTITVNTTGGITIGGASTSGTLNANGNVLINGGFIRRRNGAFNLAAGRTVTIRNGGSFISDPAFTLGSNRHIVIEAGSSLVSNGNFTISGGSVTRIDESDFILAAGRNLTIQNGGVLHWLGGDPSGIDAPAFDRTLTVTGSGSQFNSERYVSIGHNAAGTMNVLGGGRVVNRTGWIGSAAGASGIAAVSGVGSRWDMELGVFVGINGSGHLAISSGGVVDSRGGTIATETGSSGTVTVSGPGSRWVMNDELTVGRGGNGALHISAGGYVSSAGAHVPRLGSGSGLVTISGVGSTWSDSGSITIREGGTVIMQHGGTLHLSQASVRGALNVQSGGGIKAPADVVVFSSGEMNVGGPLSTAWVELGGSLRVLGGGLNIQPGSMVRASHFVELQQSVARLEGGVLIAHSVLPFDGAQLDWTGGALHVNRFGGSLLNKGGVLAPGRPGPDPTRGAAGTTVVGGDYTQQPAGSIQIELGGAVPGDQHDRVDIAGHLGAAGNVAVSLIDGFVALPGQQFRVLTFASRSGDFSISNNTGHAGLWFEKQWLPTSLTLTAAALPGDANLDGVVNIADLSRLASSWGQSGMSWLDGDFTGDGLVNIADLSVLASMWGSQMAGVSLAEAMAMFEVFDGVTIPEPPAALAAICGLAALRPRRRAGARSFSRGQHPGHGLPDGRG